MLGKNHSQTEIQQTDGILANSLVASISLQGELQIQTIDGQLLKTEEVISKLKSSRRLAKEIAIVWLPTQKIVMTEVTVPGKRKAHWMAALPFSLEESLAESIENYHVVAYHRTTEGLVSVAIATHEDMKNWKRVVESFGLQHVQLIPNCFRLENSNGELAQDSQAWTIYHQGECVLVRTSGYQGFAGNTNWYVAIKEQALNNLFLKKQQADAHIDETTVTDQDLLTSHSQNLAKVLPLSLSQSAYKSNASEKGHWYEWRWIGVLFLVTIVLYLGMQMLQTHQLQKQAAYVSQQNTKLFKVMFPQAKRIVNIKSQALTYLKQSAEGDKEIQFLMPILQQIEPWFNQAKTVKVEQLQWQSDKKQKALAITVSAPSSKEIERLISLQKESKNSEYTMTLNLKNVTAEGAEGVIYVDAN
ncbi:type II secretion system protein GspL [Thiomicrorhabdus sp.]|uniref:type II secretion system protein GspL n=1 Tax=Thiomicrorhabdus sp. TaxID=2039724 RepID=UPI002AA801D3|nr:type II secretion system protein GspL [Thiomicrorhabdus sp.]